jgi:hypothetical protein
MLVSPNTFAVSPKIIIPNGAPETEEHIQWIMDNCSACVNVSDTECITFDLAKRGFPSFWFPIHEVGQWGYAPFYGAVKVYDQFASPEKPILIHCHACVNRSVSVAYYVLSAEGYTDSEIQQHLNDKVYIPLFFRNIRQGYIPADVFDFLKARKQYPTYSLQGLLQIIKSPNLFYKKPTTM